MLDANRCREKYLFISVLPMYTLQTLYQNICIDYSLSQQIDTQKWYVVFLKTYMSYREEVSEWGFELSSVWLQSLSQSSPVITKGPTVEYCLL